MSMVFSISYLSILTKCNCNNLSKRIISTPLSWSPPPTLQLVGLFMLQPQTTCSLYRLFDQIIYYTVAHRKERKKARWRSTKSRVESVPHGDFFFFIVIIILAAAFSISVLSFRLFISFSSSVKLVFFLLSFLLQLLSGRDDTHLSRRPEEENGNK